MLPRRAVLRFREAVLLPRWGLLPERGVLLDGDRGEGEEGVVLPGR
ncbi:MAG TPA: hypothetical protein PKC45_08230 [Gemmatales bacterium]|nr:hypothetical protein [Gemmatales bacterium]